MIIFFELRFEPQLVSDKCTWKYVMHAHNANFDPLLRAESLYLILIWDRSVVQPEIADGEGWDAESGTQSSPKIFLSVHFQYRRAS